MNKYIGIILFLLSCSIFTACSDEENSGNAEVKKDHVWKETTDTIDTAKQVESMMQISVDNTQKAIEHQSE
jgi:outer membrane biogenesis lipoprotein LolB